jgi:hypothetical protein
MNKSAQRPFFSGSGTERGGSDPEATLRLIAGLKAPEGLAERVQTYLQAAPSASSRRARILAWPVAWRPENIWLQGNLMRAAAAAAIVAVVVGGGWGIYSRVQPPPPARAISIPPRVSAPGGFSSAGAIRTPQTLNGPIVAHPAVAVPPPVSSSSKHEKQTTIRRAKPAVSKAVVHPIAPAASIQGKPVSRP